MAKIAFEQDLFDLDPEKSVLQNLLERGHTVPNSCRAGICQSCKLQLVAGQVNPQAQVGLSDTLVNAGVFLSCCCFPNHDLEVQPVNLSALSHTAHVMAHEMLAQDVLRLRLKTDVSWHAGQVVNCSSDQGVVRSYSIASTPEQGYIELHIRIYPRGQFGQWAKHQLSVGDRLSIEKPFGECVYDATDDQKALVLVATGTGLSPIYGVLQDALKHQHQGTIDVYVAAGTPEQLYYQPELAALAEQMPNLHLHYVVRRAAPEGVYQGDVETLVLANHANLRNTSVYLCGANTMIDALEKKCFFRGVKREDMRVDRFITAS